MNENIFNLNNCDGLFLSAAGNGWAATYPDGFWDNTAGASGGKRGAARSQSCLQPRGFKGEFCTSVYLFRCFKTPEF